MPKTKKRTHNRFLRLINFFLLLVLLLMVAAIIMERYYDVDIKAEASRFINSLQADDDNEGEDAGDNHSTLPGEDEMTDQYGDWNYSPPESDSVAEGTAPLGEEQKTTAGQDGNDRRYDEEEDDKEKQKEQNSSSASRRTNDLLRSRHTKESPDRDEKDMEENPAGADKQSDGETLRLEPKPEESTPELLNLVESFSKWMEYQHRRSGQKYIRKAFAKKQNEACFLYLKVVDGFVKQTDDWREQTTRGIWEYWSEELQSQGVINEQDKAYVILLDGAGKPIGGSRKSKPNKLWWN